MEIEKDRVDFLQLLQAYEQAGISLMIEEHMASALTVFLLCENNDYMGDYIEDDYGKLTQIKYNRIDGK